jgi:hypothetical protein
MQLGFRMELEPIAVVAALQAVDAPRAADAPRWLSHVIGGREALERADSAVRVQSAHQSLISPLLPPLASRPSGSTAKEKTQLP